MDNGKIKRVTKRIKAFGIVQGVGFRPLVYRIAKKYEINGTVRNVGGYVEIILQSSEENCILFQQELEANQYGGYEIVKLEIEEFFEQDSTNDKKKQQSTKINNEPVKIYTDFIIINSGSSEEVSIIPPDLPICPECHKELYAATDRRYHNPFISCMSCGPRYTIIEKLPYDRDNTTMMDYEMCESCNNEYTSPESRRFHAQTISCNDCGPYLIYHEETQTDCQEEAALVKAVERIKDGGIVAVKGIGGYHFVCSPFMEMTVRNLRKLKGREEKPFAVMFETMSSIREYCYVTEDERQLLETKARPIVLLYSKVDLMAPSTNQGSIYCGAFLPYTPLQLLLTKLCGPLIMTSANEAGKPIIRDEVEMLALQSTLLQGVLYNTRRIVRAVDDSVAKIIDQKPQIIRRSRGYVPYPVFLSMDQSTDKMILATGGDLKAAFCLYHNGSAVVSQYFGDLEEVTVMNEYQASVTDISRLLKILPSLVVCDLHPNYHSVHYAKSLGLPVLQVQHHHAHIASVMAEHDLKESVIGIAFDGTGYGTDGCIWGGEFLICEGAEFERAAHLKYTEVIGGDSSMKDAKKTATCYLLNNELEDYCIDNRKNLIQSSLKHHINTLSSSSMGRLFDAIASLLDIQQENRYEGECAALLEKVAVLAIRNNVIPAELSFAIEEKNEIIEINPKPVLEAICKLKSSKEVGSLALGFHYALSEMIGRVCETIRQKRNMNTVALSGGVFQNTVLTEQTLQVLREKGFQVYGNMAVPPNDGGISLGQTWIGLRKELN